MGRSTVLRASLSAMGRAQWSSRAVEIKWTPGQEFQSRGYLPIIVEMDQRVDTGVLMVSSVTEGL